jgi:hypothetical protein
MPAQSAPLTALAPAAVDTREQKQQVLPEDKNGFRGYTVSSHFPFPD